MSLYDSRYRGTGLARALFNAFIWLYLRPRVFGRGHLPERGPFILAANHASHADTAALYAALPRRLRARTVAAAARDYFFENPIRRAAARALFNAVPVDRRPIAGRDPLRHAIRALRAGYGLLIYPEGTRSPDGGVSQFRGGIGRLAALFPDAPIIPVWLETAQVMPKGTVIPQPRAVRVRFGAPLHLTAAREDRASWQAAADAVREAVLRLSDEAEGRLATATEDEPAWRRWPRAFAASIRRRMPRRRRPADEEPLPADDAPHGEMPTPAAPNEPAWRRWPRSAGEAIRRRVARLRGWAAVGNASLDPAAPPPDDGETAPPTADASPRRLKWARRLSWRRSAEDDSERRQ